MSDPGSRAQEGGESASVPLLSDSLGSLKKKTSLPDAGVID